MRCFCSLCLIVACCCIVQASQALRAFGNDQARRSVFRVLTSEQSEDPAMAAGVVKNAVGAATQAPAGIQRSAPQPVVNSSWNSDTRPYSPATAVNSVHTQIGFYGNNTGRQTTSAFPRRPTIHANAQRTVRQLPKPFTGFEHEPTLNPYLILDEDDDDTQSVPSYLTQVQPRVAQLQINRAQQREIQQLRGQLQKTTSGVSASSRYMNTAQFYSGRR